MTKTNITHVVESNLCSSCGACFAVCNSQAISFEETIGGNYFPVVDDQSCAKCELCCSVCPGAHFSDGLKNKIIENPFAGQCIDAFVGKATNKNVYDNSQSGGVVSALAIYAMESGLADAVVTVVMDWGNPPRPRAILARSDIEIILSQKSKYCPIPTLSILKDVIGSDQRIIFVGTSCQVHGLLNILEQIPKTKNNIVLIIGLVCDRVMTYAALDYLLRKARLSDEADHLLIFRDKAYDGYPGSVHIKSKGGQNKILSEMTRMRIKDYFTPARCRICFDKMNIFADVTVGDPHGLEKVDREHGESMIVVRTKNGQDIVQSARGDNAINIRSVAYKKIIDGQHIDDKRMLWSSYTYAWKISGRHLPDFYELIKRHVPDPSVDKKIFQSMNYAFQLDNFYSRDALIAYVRNTLTKQILFRKLLFPLRIVKRIVMKIQSVLV